MSVIPSNPPIFHITHMDNLSGIVRAGGLWSDAQCLARKVSSTNIGHRHIKQRRMARPVTAGAGGTLGEYVPFNFCPRSVMLYAVHRGHDDYNGGQGAIVHLVSDVQTAIAAGRPWAFTDRHAELAHALHYANLADLEQVPWQVMHEKYWQEVKEERQAEFLVHEFFPWTAITQVAVIHKQVAEAVRALLGTSEHQPGIAIQPKWYY